MKFLEVVSYLHKPKLKIVCQQIYKTWERCLVVNLQCIWSVDSTIPKQAVTHPDLRLMAWEWDYGISPPPLQ